jgi:hypothetical protein
MDVIFSDKLIVPNGKRITSALKITPGGAFYADVIALGKAPRVLQGESPCLEKASHPPVSSIDLIEEPVMVNKIVR